MSLVPNNSTEPPRPPRPFWSWQDHAIAFGEGRDHVGFFMDKRLGKIRVASTWAIRRGARRILVSAPLSAIPDWQDELERDGYSSCFLYGTAGERLNTLIANSNFDGARFFLINPQGLYTAASRSGSKATPSEIARMPWDAVLWDESTNLKNPQSQLNEIAHLCFYRPDMLRAILSGEPAPEGPQDLFEQMRWLNGGVWMGHSNFWKWRVENFSQSGYEWFCKKGRLSFIKEAVNARAFTLSRKDAGVAHAPPYYEKRWVKLPDSIREHYDNAELNFELPQQLQTQLQREAAEADAVGGGEAIETKVSEAVRPRETKYAVVVDNWLAQLCGGYPKDFPNLHSDHKLHILLDILLEEMPKEQIVVAFRYNSELHAAAAALAKHKSVFSILTGATAPAERRNVQHAFQAGKLRWILGQIRVLQFGIDLSAARTMVRYSLPPNYEIISQSKDRIVHVTKTDPVSYIDLVVRDSVDEDTISALGDKAITARFFMNKMQEFKNKRIKTVAKKGWLE